MVTAMRKSLLLLGVIPVVLFSKSNNSLNERDFAVPIDALSVAVSSPTLDLAVSGWDGKEWSTWEQLTLATEDNPLSTESSLVMFPHAVSKIRFRGSTLSYALHPIRISQEPIHYTVASLTAMRRPRILSRGEWGADEDLLFASTSSENPPPSSSQSNVENKRSDEVPKRVSDCEQTIRDYPEDFRTVNTVYKDRDGKRYVWPRKYSPEIKLLSVNHTAMSNDGDTRSPVERLRAIYQYHAKSLGWGDIGYHYLIDENGQIYQGKSGGDYVVGGHAYCANVDTIGISLMGNFEVEKPTQVQLHSLQWLLSSLAEKYDIDLTKSVSFQGKMLPPIVGHKDLNVTACPGYYVRESLDQIRAHVVSGDLYADIDLPPPPVNAEQGGESHPEKYKSQVEERRAKRIARLPTTQLLRPGLSVWGSDTIEGRPGSQVLVSIRYRTGSSLVQTSTNIGSVTRSDPAIGLWVRKDNGTELQVDDALLLPRPVAPSDTILLTLKVQFPLQAGSYTLQIGDVTYKLNASGRRWMGR